jgi:hypothetical protein
MPSLSSSSVGPATPLLDCGLPAAADVHGRELLSASPFDFASTDVATKPPNQNDLPSSNSRAPAADIAHHDVENEFKS